MPSILSKQLASKLLGSEWSFGYNCYEVGHTWTPFCTDAALEVSLAAGARVLPLYALLYGFSQVAVTKRLDTRASLDTLSSIVRSTAFISFHIYNGSIVGCALRNSFGRFYYRVLVCLPALVSSYLSLLIEKPSRRQALAFYVLNLASEILYRMAVTKGYFVPVRYGETILFAASLSAWYYLIKAHGFGRDPVSGVVKYLIGRDEAKRYVGGKRRSSSVIKQKLQDGTQQQVNEKNLLAKFNQKWIDLIDYLGKNWLGNRHTSCPHKTQDGRQASTCLYYVVESIPSRLLAGILVHATLKLSSNPSRLIANPMASIRRALTSRDSLRFGLFLVTLVSSGRLSSCLLRRYSQSNDNNWHALVSGFVAGLSMLWSPKSSISMYVMWKAVEQYYLLAAKQGRVKYFDFSILTIYSLSAATILYTFALEPSLMRPSYMKFLDKISDHRLHQLNRMVLDVFGTGSSVGYEDYFPDLDPKLMSNQFKELIFNWMIQPYE